MPKKINIAIIGATGFTGLDLVFFLSKHPQVKICNLCATKNMGKKISFFDKRIKKKLPKISSIKMINWSKIDLVFLSLPNGEAQKIVKKTYSKYKHLRFIDLSADFRIQDTKVYKKNYKINHGAKNLIRYSLYSISEFVKKEIFKYRIIANPGCYPTSIQIPLIPLIKKNLINKKRIIIDAKSGFSGAGKNFEKKFRYKNLYQSIHAYAVNGHRHIAEIDQEFKKISKNIQYTFNPQVIPTFRGILTSIYLNLEKKQTAQKIREHLYNYYKKDKFIKVLKLNSELGTGNVLNSNYVEISVCQTRVKNSIVIFSAIDNLVKGASGQAIQNMNLIYNFTEGKSL